MRVENDFVDGGLRGFVSKVDCDSVSLLELILTARLSMVGRGNGSLTVG